MHTKLEGEGEVTFVYKEFASGRGRAGEVVGGGGVRHTFILK